MNTIMILFFVMSSCYLEKIASFHQYLKDSSQKVWSRLTRSFWKQFQWRERKQREFKSGREKSEYLS